MCKKRARIKLCIFFGIIVLIIFLYSFFTVNEYPSLSKSYGASADEETDHNVWLIFTKASKKSILRFKFKSLIVNLLSVSSLSLRFSIIVDEESKFIAEKDILQIQNAINRTVHYDFYIYEECVKHMIDIVETMTPFFSSAPGTYYSDALFFISLGLYRFAPLSQTRAILLDCDVYFKEDIAILFKEFENFKPTALFGLAPELTPVYKHVLHSYKKRHNTTLGEPYRWFSRWTWSKSSLENSDLHPRGYQGFNSGIVLFRFDKLRDSIEYREVLTKDFISKLAEKYLFQGHLGDQDFYTLLGFENAQLIQTLNCGYNRQLCTWWRDHGYRDIFDQYFQCNHKTVIIHGNCNTDIPKN